MVTILIWTSRIGLKNYDWKKNCSQADLGKMLCLSKMAVSHWEKGNSEPSIAQLKILADFFDVSVDYLIGREN
ncbi:MAG: helix-turn-helix domain-containing protein [Acutalibacteraceae bacterium]